MYRNGLLVIALVALIALPMLNAAPPPYPKLVLLEPGDKVRGQLFDLLRPSHEKRTGVPTKFRGELRVYKNWAVFIGDSVDEQGLPIADKKDAESTDVAALWSWTKAGGWKLEDYSFGHTDAFYIDKWPKKFGVPKEMLP